MFRRSLIALAVTATACATTNADIDVAPATIEPEFSTAPSRPPGTEPDDGPERDADTSPLIVVTDDRGVEVSIESTERIIPLDGDLAEIVFALGLGDRVVATDLSATFPPAADAKPEIGYQRALSAEPILEHRPTVLLATDIAGPPETLDDLERLGVPLVMVPTPADRTGPGVTVRAVAEALGVGDLGQELADQVDADIADVLRDAETRTGDGPLVAPLYLRGEGTQLVLGTEMSIDWMLDALGARNVADVLDIEETTPINIEALVELQPDVIVATTSGLASVGGIDGLLDLPGFAEMPAGQHRRIIAFDDQYLLGNGPRTADLLVELDAALHEPDPDRRSTP